MNKNLELRLKELRLKGQLDVLLFDKHGKLKKVLTAKNGITNAGKDKLLGVMFNAQTAITTWYVGLIDSTSFTGLAAGDTMASHAGWLESTAYTEAARVAWVEDTPASQQITNSAAVVFSINATGTMKGFFLNSLAPKGIDDAGTLWSTALFDGGDQAVASGDKIHITYTLST